MGNISIKWQFIIVCVLLVTVPVIILGVLTFNTSRQTILDNVEETLRVQCIDWSIIIQSYYDLVEENKRSAKATTQGIISSQSLGVSQMIQSHFKEDLTAVALKEPLSRARKNEKSMLVNIFSIKEFKRYAKQFDSAIKEIKEIIDEATSKNIDTEEVTLALSEYLKEIDNLKLKESQAVGELDEVVATRGNGLERTFLELSGELSDERLKEVLSSTVIGKTGYVYIIDYKGNYILSKDRKRDGENIWYVEDSEGGFVIQDVVAKGKALEGSGIDYHTYPWKETKDSQYREQQVAIMHIPQKQWIVGTVIYPDELIESELEEIKKEELKELMANQTFGRTGRLSIIRTEEEEDVFIKDIVEEAKTLDKGESRIKHYSGIGLLQRQEVLAYSYFRSWNWIIVASIYLDEFFEDINAVKNKIILICIIAIILGSSIVYFFASLMTRTFSQLVGKMNKVAKGDLDLEMDDVNVLGDKNEMGQLANAFKKMTDNLRDTTFSKDYVDNIIGNMNDALFVTDEDARIVMVNEATCQLIGGTETEIVKYSIGNFLMSGNQALTIFNQKLFKGEVIENLEMELKNKKGKSIPVSINGASLKDSEGKITHAVLVARDISEHKRLLGELSIARKNLEEKLQKLEKSDKAMLFMVDDLNKTTGELKIARNKLEEKIAEVEKTNKELDDFTYIVSHDLKEPLRGVKAFTKLLSEDYSEKLDKEAKDYISTISDSSSRMTRLIEDLLNLSRIGRVGSVEPDVDLSGLLSDVKKDLAYSLEEKHAELKLAKDFPKVTCDRVRMREVFANLISNAIKYSKKDVKPIIEVGYSQKDKFHEFYVKDNGLGIEKEFYDKVFQIFQRLHAKGEHEGSGAGLAIVKKIVVNHGGKIWVESKAGEGSTFYFTIKKE